MTYLVFSAAQGFNRATAVQCETLADVGREALAYDVSAWGVDETNGVFTPWQQPHRGPRKVWSRAAGASEVEALELAAGLGDLDYLTEQQAAELEAEMDGE